MINTRTLPQIAKAIKALEKKTIQNVVEIGKLLHEAKEQCNHGEYLPWLKDNFSWSDDTARRYSDIYRLSQIPQFAEFGKLDISISALNRAAICVLDEDSDYQAAGKAIIKAAKRKRVSCKMAIDIENKTIADLNPISDEPAPAIEPSDDESSDADEKPDDKDDSELAKSIVAALVLLDDIAECNPVWSEIMCGYNVERLRQVHTMLGAIYTKHVETSRVKAAADRAKDRAERVTKQGIQEQPVS